MDDLCTSLSESFLTSTTSDSVEPKQHVMEYPKTHWLSPLEQSAFTPRKLRVVCIGAGYAGLNLAYEFNKSGMDKYVDFTIYEKNSEVGGVWYENTYPGIQCDLPAHGYTFAFEPNPNWSSFYASGAEIEAYIKTTTKKHGLDKDVKFDAKMLESVWDESSKKWKLKIDLRGSVLMEEADVLINACGILNKSKWPEIPGLMKFKGELVHSAKWNPKTTWEGKRVAVIGNGASAVQILPQIQPKAAKIVNFARSPTWIFSNIGDHLTRDGKNFKYTEAEKKAFAEDENMFREFREGIDFYLNQYIHVTLKDSPVNAMVTGAIKGLMATRLHNDPQLMEKLTPNYPVGCRRGTPSDNYLECIQAPNASAVFDPIVRITETGIVTTAGNEQEFDLIVCATGFETNFAPHWTVKGTNNFTFGDEWKQNPEAYLGTCVRDMPNYFIMTGPNSPIIHGNLLAAMGWKAVYILSLIRKIASENIVAVVPSARAIRDYNRTAQGFLDKTVWAADCRSWYKNGKIDGKITATYAGSMMHFKAVLESGVRGEDFEWVYGGETGADEGNGQGNSFQWWGNGFAIGEGPMKM